VTIVVCLKMSGQDDIFDPWEKDPTPRRLRRCLYIMDLRGLSLWLTKQQLVDTGESLPLRDV